MKKQVGGGGNRRNKEAQKESWQTWDLKRCLNEIKR